MESIVMWVLIVTWLSISTSCDHFVSCNAPSTGVAFQEFTSKERCLEAANLIKDERGVSYRCVPK